MSDSPLKMRVVDMVWVRAGDILPHPENWREHGPEQKDAFAAMMEGVGFAGALLTFTLPDGDLMMIDGHLRADQHPDEKLPVLVTDLNEDEARELLATHDPLSALATANKARLKALHSKFKKIKGRRLKLLKKIRESHGVVLDDELPADDPGAQVDRAGELQEKWQVGRGDVWEIPSLTLEGSSHRIMCGDSTCAEDVEKLMRGQKADAVVTDPPYGDNWVAPRWTTSNPVSAILNDSGDDFYKTIKMVFVRISQFVKTPSFAWVFAHGGKKVGFALEVAQMAAHYTLNNIAVWDKGDLGMGFLLRNQWESILLLSCGDRITDAWNGGHSTPNIFSYTTARVTEGQHPTPKPVELFGVLVESVSKDRALIVDPFLGSGTTLVACEQTGRIGYGMEIEPKYVAVSLERLAGMGLSPRRTIE